MTDRLTLLRSEKMEIRNQQLSVTISASTYVNLKWEILVRINAIVNVTDWAVSGFPQVYWSSHFCSKSLNDEVYLNTWKPHAGVRINSAFRIKNRSLYIRTVYQRTIDNQSLSVHYFIYNSSQIWSCFEAHLWYLIDDHVLVFWACIKLCVCVDTVKFVTAM